MWKWLMDALPHFHVGTFEVRDLLSLVLACLGAYIARQAYNINKWQKKMMEEDQSRKASLEIWMASARIL